MSLLGDASNPLQGASGLPRRVANRRAAPSCLAWMAGLALAPTGCGRQAPVALPHKSALPALPGSPIVNLISTLVLRHGRWLVSNQIPVVLSCAP